MCFCIFFIEIQKSIAACGDGIVEITSASPIVSGSQVRVCPGGQISVTFTFDGDMPYSAKLYVFNNSPEYLLASATNITTTSYTLYYTLTDNMTFAGDFLVGVKPNGCESEDEIVNFDYPFQFLRYSPPLNRNFRINGGFCFTSPGYELGLQNRQSGVTYSLWKDLVNTGITSSISGSGITFGNQTSVGIYQIKGTNSNNCSIFMSDQLTIKPVPTVPTYTYTACDTNQISVKGSSATTAAGIIWERIGGELTTTVNHAIFTYPATVMGMQTFNARAVLDGCESTATPDFTVTPIPYPNITISTSTPNVCNIAGNNVMPYTIANFPTGGP